MRPHSGSASNHDGSRPSSSSNSDANANGGERVFAHISDLKLQALSGFNRQGSIQQLLRTAEVGLNQANMLLDFRRPDMSYVEYLRTAQIVVEEIPRHKQWADFQMDRDGGFQRYSVLQKRVHSKTEQYTIIKDMIVDNNRRSGVQSRTNSKGEADGGMDQINGSTQGNGVVQAGTNATRPHKSKPLPTPKPESLHGRAINGTVSAIDSDDLNARFARLRMMQTNGMSNGGGTKEGTAVSMQATPLTMPNANDFRATNRPGSSSSDHGLATKPKGPRGMPNGAPGPPLPEKTSLDTSVAPFMPKPPSPTYSPARNMQTTGNIAPPRHSARSLVSTSNRRSHGVPALSSASTHAPNGSASSLDYLPNVTQVPGVTTGVSRAPLPTRKKSVHVPKETAITAERLYDYLIYFSILLIDFRSREEFDQGHIFHRSIVNVDPLMMSSGMSASEIFDRMVLSPDIEQDLFMNRSTYDLVVYYDANTNCEAFLNYPETDQQLRLKYLHEALYDFNHDSPLMRPPILLIGGIEAWTDLIGQQALATSNTAALTKQAPSIPRRPGPRTVGSSQLQVSRRRLRDYNPLDADEEMTWRERARAESVVLPSPAQYDELRESATEDDDAEQSEAAIQEFLQRFPEAGALETPPYYSSAPSRPPPEVPAKVPIYPPAPPPSQPFSVPTRPPPAVSRPSYTGVSERAAQSVSVSRSAQLAPYVPPKYLATNLRLPKTGLQNFGQTCYMNATLQALSATTPLSIFFLDNRFKSMIQQENWKGTKGVMPELYSNLVRNLWKGDVNYIRPSTFKTFCGRMKKEWGTNDQQDAKEFLDFVVDCLHEDLNSMWARTPLRALTAQEEAKRERMPKQVVAKTEWDRYTHRELSFLTELFGGQHLSRLKCSHCGWTSTTYEAFYSISVEIPQPGTYSGQFPTLDDCMRSYCKEEPLTGDDRFKCEGQCKVMRDGTKQILITRVPQCLIVHFKRFSTNAFGRPASKVRTVIDFPLRAFNLEPYVLPQPGPEEAEFIARTQPNHVPEPCMTPPYTYDAYAVVRHLGVSMQSGHYTTAVKDRARSVWRYFNDERVEDFQPGQGAFRGSGDLRNEQAYIVFYQRNATDTEAAPTAVPGVEMGMSQGEDRIFCDM